MFVIKNNNKFGSGISGLFLLMWIVFGFRILQGPEKCFKGMTHAFFMDEVDMKNVLFTEFYTLSIISQTPNFCHEVTL